MTRSAAMDLEFPPTRYSIRPAGIFWTKVLDVFGFDAITVPGRRIYIRPSHINDQALINHELAHIAQIDRDGPFVFWPMIVLDYLLCGYDRSPYEIEARRYEQSPR